MNNIFFYLPFGYFFKTRLKSTGQRLSWIIIYIIPTFFMMYYYDALLEMIDLIISYMASLVAIYCVYELGYIQNDTETIYQEAYPTKRLQADALKYYDSHKIPIWVLRYGITLFCLMVLFLVSKSLEAYLLFCSLIVFLHLLYQIYNRNNGKWKIVIHFLLVCIRFMAFPLLVNDRALLHPTYWSLLFIFPIPNLIERGSEQKFDFGLAQMLTGMRASIDRFRFYYYLVIAIAGTLLYVYFGEYLIFCLLAFYFLIYRFLIFSKLFSFAKRASI